MEQVKMTKETEVKVLEEQVGLLIDLLEDEWSKSKRMSNIEHFTVNELNNIIKKILASAIEEGEKFDEENSPFEEIIRFDKNNAVILRLAEAMGEKVAECEDKDKEIFIEFDEEEWSVFRSIVFAN